MQRLRGLRQQIQDQIWHKQFTEEELNKYVGWYEACYLTYAQDAMIRQGAASGGSVTALLVYLLESGQVDGVLVVRTVVQDGKARAEYAIATTRQAILEARGSKYSAVYFSQHGLPLLKQFEGRVAAVLLPCDARILSVYRQKNPDFSRKIHTVITLFCGHNSIPELTDMVTEKLGRGHGELVDYSYRTGHWRGELTATYRDGTQIKKPFSTFSDYRNVYFYAQKKCHHCFDHFGYFCDVSAGDIWSPQMKDEPIKHTALIARSEQGHHLIQAATEANYLVKMPTDVSLIANGQARTLPFHYNISARAKVAGLFGDKVRDETREKVRWNDVLVALMALFNEWLTRWGWGRMLVKRLPRPLLKLYLYIFKGLESI